MEIFYSNYSDIYIYLSMYFVVTAGLKDTIDMEA